MSDRIYLYLTKPEWSRAWTHGGHVPIQLASEYKRPERDRIYTPDENIVHTSPVDLLAHPVLKIAPTASVKNLNMKNSFLNGKRLPDLENADYYQEDGLILSFSTRKRLGIAERLGKAACVEILDVGALKGLLDRQIGVTGQMGRCKYTRDHQRHHFLKHADDAWQSEYRLYWKASGPRTVYINPGTARRVSLPSNAAYPARSN